MVRPLLDKSPMISRTAGRRNGALARLFVTRQAASGGLPNGQVL